MLPFFYISLEERGQTVHWIGAYFCVSMFLNSRDKSLNMFQNLSGLHLQKFRGFRVQIPVTEILSAHFFLLRIPQQANIASCSGATVCGFRKM